MEKPLIAIGATTVQKIEIYDLNLPVQLRLSVPAFFALLK